MNGVREIEKKNKITVGQNTCHSNSAANSVTKYDKINPGKEDIPECWTIEMFLCKKEYQQKW
jgi:hypothetical protein